MHLNPRITISTTLALISLPIMLFSQTNTFKIKKDSNRIVIIYFENKQIKLSHDTVAIDTYRIPKNGNPIKKGERIVSSNSSSNYIYNEPIDNWQNIKTQLDSLELNSDYETLQIDIIQNNVKFTFQFGEYKMAFDGGLLNTPSFQDLRKLLNAINAILVE